MCRAGASAAAVGAAIAKAAGNQLGGDLRGKDAHGYQDLVGCEDHSELIKRLVDKIPNEFKQNFRCTEFESALEKLLKENGISGEKITVQSKSGFIWSEKYGRISENGVHYAIRVDDMIFDNLNPKGIFYSDWISDLGINLDPELMSITQNAIG